MAIIKVEGLTKEYRLGQLESLKTTALNQIRRLTGQSLERRPPFKALDDVSFTIEEGEVVGIIGHNGAGKSTLLKILAGITAPTSGTIRVNGRINPLIEVGAGFVPELTGRENVYINGSILGLSRKAIDRKFEEIVEFAEMAEFIDTPVKRYSSGMQVKLAFSVATSIDSQILIVDEVLAVGDLAFQRKCFDRMESLIKSQRRTVLMVSHNIRQVLRLCSRVILLNHGKITANGPAPDVADRFYSESNQKIQTDRLADPNIAARLRTSGELDVQEICILDEHNRTTDTIESGAPLRVRLTLLVHHPVRSPEIVVGTHTTDFVYLTAASTAEYGRMTDFAPGPHVVECDLPGFPLVAGSYCVRLSIFDGSGRLLLTGETLKTFQVEPTPGEAARPPLRTLHIPTSWRVDDEILEGASFSNDSERYDTHH